MGQAWYTLRSFRAKYYLWRSDWLGCWGDSNPKPSIQRSDWPGCWGDGNPNPSIQRSDWPGCWGDGNPKKPIMCPSHFIRALARCFSIHKTSLARCFPIHNTSLARCFPIHKTSLARCFQIHNSLGNVFATSHDKPWQGTTQSSVGHVWNSGSAYIVIMGRVLEKNISG